MTRKKKGSYRKLGNIQISETVPDVVVTVQGTKYLWDDYIVQCPYCGEKHVHHILGLRSSLCKNSHERKAYNLILKEYTN